MAAFKVFTHFDLNVLADQFAQEIKVRPKDVDLLSSEYLIIQTPGMKRWLALESARRNSVFAQVSSFMPKQFIMKLGYLLLGIQEKRSVFEREILPWALYRLIDEGMENRVPELQQLKDYCGDENKEMRLFTLAEKIADIFDQYMLYRPDWLEAWETGHQIFDKKDSLGKNEEWQKYLWNRLIAENQPGGVVSPSKYIKMLLEKMEHVSDEEKKRLPKRIFLFGMSILPPQYLQIFSKLGDLIDVTLYLQIPSIHYYGDVLSDRQIQWRQRNALKTGDENIKDVIPGNALLRNLGKMGKEFMDLILNTKNQLNELFDLDQVIEHVDERVSLLHRVQWDVKMCSNSAPEPILCQEDDWSVRLAACYGPLREVEVLHDLLLDCFSSDRSLSPSDVLIVTPDIGKYGPLVQLVFGDAKQLCGVSMPFTIADQSVLSENVVAKFAQDILSAVFGRFELSVILPLFERTSELSGIPISVNEQEQLRHWCTNSGIRWGYNKEFRKNLQLPETDEYTWRYGIDRLIAGFVMDEELKLPDGLYPAVELEGDGAELLGRLADFVDALAQLASFSREPRTMSEWNDIFASMIRRLFALKDDLVEDDGSADAVFGRALFSLRERTEISRTESQKFPFSIFMQSVIDELSQSSFGSRFLNGTVTAAGMIPMRSLPFRVVAMIGMNRGDFPRHTVRPLFDLMSQTAPRDGDRDSLKSDRYVFLETVLSAQDKLIMTWSGYDNGDGSEMPPSVLVEEFKAHLDREYQIAGRKEKAGEAVFVKYPLHPFSARYQSSEMNEVQLQTWNRSWFKPAEKSRDRKPIFQWECIQKLNADDDAVDGNKIYRTLSDPMKSFLDACRIEVPSKDEIVESVELFEMGGLDEWKLRDAVKREKLCDDPEIIGRLAAGGGIPPGIPGQTAIADVKKKVRSRFEKIRSIDDAPKFGFHRINAETLGIRYRMDIDLISITDDGSSGKMFKAIIADFGRANAKRKLNLWITHLFLNLEKQTETILVALDSTVRLKALTHETAMEHIFALNKLMKENKQRLLPFIPDVSLAFTEAKDIELSRDGAWKKLEELSGLAFNKEYLLDPRIKEAFEDSENWADAMKKIPGGEDAFKEMSNRVFRPFLDTMEEGE